MRDRERSGHWQREKQAHFGKPEGGLDPRILGSQLEPKADAQPLSHPGALKLFFKKVCGPFVNAVVIYFIK